MIEVQSLLGLTEIKLIQDLLGVVREQKNLLIDFGAMNHTRETEDIKMTQTPITHSLTHFQEILDITQTMILKICKMT